MGHAISSDGFKADRKRIDALIISSVEIRPYILVLPSSCIRVLIK